MMGMFAIVDDGTITTVNTAVDPAVTTTATMDWSDRLIIGWFRGLGGATEYPGGANDYLFDAGTLFNFYGYTGLGALNGAMIAMRAARLAATRLIRATPARAGAMRGSP